VLQHFLPLRFQPKSALLVSRNSDDRPALFPNRREETTMRWKISPHGHDPRQIDLLAVVALLIVIVGAYVYYVHNPEPPSTTAFIVPSQSTRW
jgi:hypothetical protein